MTISEPSQRAVAEADRANKVNGFTLLTVVFNNIDNSIATGVHSAVCKPQVFKVC